MAAGRPLRNLTEEEDKIHLNDVNIGQAFRGSLLTLSGNFSVGNSMLRESGVYSDTFTNFAVNVVVAIAISTSIVCAVLTSPAIINLSALFTTTFSPYVIYQRKKINRQDSMRLYQKRLGENMSALTVENSNLHVTLSDLESRKNRLMEVSAEFIAIANKSKYAPEKIVEVIKEAKKVKSDFESELRRQFIAEIFANVLTVVRGGNYLDDGKIEILILRLTLIPDLKFNESKLREFLYSQENRSIPNLFIALRDRLSKRKDDHDDIFETDLHLIDDIQRINKKV